MEPFRLPPFPRQFEVDETPQVLMHCEDTGDALILDVPGALTGDEVRELDTLFREFRRRGLSDARIRASLSRAFASIVRTAGDDRDTETLFAQLSRVFDAIIAYHDPARDHADNATPLPSDFTPTVVNVGLAYKDFQP